VVLLKEILEAHSQRGKAALQPPIVILGGEDKQAMDEVGWGRVRHAGKGRGGREGLANAACDVRASAPHEVAADHALLGWGPCLLVARASCKNTGSLGCDSCVLQQSRDTALRVPAP